MSESHFQNPYDASSNAGRWNPKGTKMIYAASDPALAQLEYLCIRGFTLAKARWYMIVFEIADEKWVGTLEAERFPEDWAALPHGKATQEVGKVWLDYNEFPFLQVPSARLHLAFYPRQFNLLINPTFPDIAKWLKVIETVPFSYLLN